MQRAEIFSPDCTQRSINAYNGPWRSFAIRLHFRSGGPTFRHREGALTLSIVVHCPLAAPDASTPEAIEAKRQAVRDAVWEIADAHWALGSDSILVSTDLSPDYLVSHFRRAVERRGFEDSGLLLVTSVGPKAAWAGLPQEAEGWLQEVLP